MKNKGLIAFLLLLVIFIGLLAYQNSRDFSMLKDAFDTEKQELENELQQVIEEYQSINYENHEFSGKIKDQLGKAISLRDTIQGLKVSNFNLLRMYRKRISNLEKENKELLNKLDSISKLNQNLFIENDSVKGILSETEQLNSELYNSNRALSRKIETATALEISNVDFSAMKKKSSGKLTTTYRSWKTDAFRVKFDLLENKIIDKGIIPIYIQLINPKNEVIYVKGRTQLKNGKRIIYTNTLKANYFNNTLAIMSLIDVDKEKMEKGNYKVKIYVNGKYLKESIIKLK
ncbi:hypothetical protein [Tenacibaculum xiamenense]|uniref:hypothetical protein n=1 Tax=Tenacibaculum xiamenense TaxID=1261553 RepID=UPI0038B5523B